MIIKEHEIELKNGKKALLRSPGDDLVEELIDYLRTSSGETEFLIRYPDEFGDLTHEAEKKIIDAKRASDSEAMIVATVDGKVAGCCSISWSTRFKLRHRASVAIALLRDYWGLGLGTRLLEELIRIAEEDGQILQLELDFIEGNSRARALYEKLGFRITGVKPNAARLRDGRMLNEYSMIREIKR